MNDEIFTPCHVCCIQQTFKLRNPPIGTFLSSVQHQWLTQLSRLRSEAAVAVAAAPSCCLISEKFGFILTSLSVLRMNELLIKFEFENIAKLKKIIVGFFIFCSVSPIDFSWRQPKEGNIIFNNEKWILMPLTKSSSWSYQAILEPLDEEHGAVNLWERVLGPKDDLATELAKLLYILSMSSIWKKNAFWSTNNKMTLVFSVAQYIVAIT